MPMNRALVIAHPLPDTLSLRYSFFASLAGAAAEVGAAAVGAAAEEGAFGFAVTTTAAGAGEGAGERCSDFAGAEAEEDEVCAAGGFAAVVDDALLEAAGAGVGVAAAETDLGGAPAGAGAGEAVGFGCALAAGGGGAGEGVVDAVAGVDFAGAVDCEVGWEAEADGATT